MKNKIKYILTVVLILLVGIGVYKGVNLYTEHIETLEREAELELIRNEIRDRIRYANWMFFQNNFLYYDMHDDFFSTMDIYDSFFGGRVNISEVIFVHSAEEAEGFAEDVFVAWPTEGSEMFLELINDWLDPEVIGMLQHIDNTRITIDDLNVELPLKQELMVKDWEMMNEIMGRLSNDLVADLLGSWRKAIHGTNYDYEYIAPDTCKITINTAGDYKINYLDQVDE